MNLSSASNSNGFTLIELMVAIGIIAVISAIAIPFYNDYIETGREGVLVSNISTIEIFQEDFRLRNGTYAVDLADIAAITAAIGWTPQANDGVTYAIAASDGSFYEVTATNPDGDSVCIQFPARDRC